MPDRLTEAVEKEQALGRDLNDFLEALPDTIAAKVNAYVAARLEAARLDVLDKEDRP